MSVFTFRLSKLASRHRLRSHSHRVLSGLKGGINWCAFPSSFKFTFRVRRFHLGFQTQENWWKHEAAGRVFFIVFECLETLMKPDARVLKKSLLNRASGIKENGNIHEFFTCCQTITCFHWIKKWVHYSLMLSHTQGFDNIWNSWIARHCSVSPGFQTTCTWRNWRVSVGWSPYE